MKFSFIPDKNQIKEAILLSEKTGMNWEINDFVMPKIYDDSEAISNLVSLYRNCGRNLSGDTFHGAFLGIDIAAIDPVMMTRSRELCRQSMEIASKIGVSGVVFHTGLIGGLRLDYYLRHWLEEAQAFFGELCGEYPEITVFMENSFEQEPDVFTELMQRTKDIPNYRLCLDYGHGILTQTAPDVWVRDFAPYLGHMHLNDNDLRDDLHLIPGKGKIDFPKWLELIRQISYDGSVLLEVTGHEKAEASYEFMKRIVNEGVL